MNITTRPEPDPEAREAIALALERLLRADELPAAYGSRWRAEGIAENLDGEDETPEGQRTTDIAGPAIHPGTSTTGWTHRRRE